MQMQMSHSEMIGTESWN